MKKYLTKTLALLVALATMLATTVCTAFAAEPTIIDYTQKASLTVHKYSEDSFRDSTQYLTQKEMQDYINAQGNLLTPLADVTFRYLKVGDVKQYTKNVIVNGKTTNVVKIGYSINDALVALLGLTDSDIDMNVNGVNYYDVSDLDRALNKVSATKVEQYIQDQPAHVDMAATDANGVAKATGLDLGLYLLVEYSYLANTVGNEQHGHSVPSLVPLPVTDHTADGTYSWCYDVNVYPKNIIEDITVDKVIVGNDNNETKEWDTEINATVEYLIRADVPHAIGKLQTYTVNDTLSDGLDYDTDSYTVYAVASDGTRTALTANNQFNFTNPNSHKMTWAFKGTTLADAEGWAKYDSIEIRYTATPNKNAIVGKDGNPNYCNLIVSHTTNTDTTEGDREKTDTYVPTEMPKVFTYAVDLTKYGDSDSQNALQGVTYELQDKDGNVIKVSEQTAGTAGKYYFDPANGAATLTTDADGKLYIKGFEAGTYYLKETATNNGYSLLADKIQIVIDSNENTYTMDNAGTYARAKSAQRFYTDTTFSDTTGSTGIIAGTDTVQNDYNWFVLPSISADQPASIVPDDTFVHFNTSNLHWADGSAVQMFKQNKLTWNCNFIMGTDRTATDSGVIAIVVNDQQIFELPHTGGIGKYVAVGTGFAALAAAAAFIVIERKRKSVG